MNLAYIYLTFSRNTKPMFVFKMMEFWEFCNGLNNYFNTDLEAVVKDEAVRGIRRLFSKGGQKFLLSDFN